MPKSGSSRHRQLELLSDRPQFQQGQHVGQIKQALGENIYEVEKENGETILYQLPSRLRNVAFIRRGSFVFVKDDSTRGPGKIRGDIEVVVLDRFLKVLRKEAFWPQRFKEANEGSTVNQDGERDRADDDIGPNWEVGQGNPNRRVWEDGVDSESEEEQ